MQSLLPDPEFTSSSEDSYEEDEDEDEIYQKIQKFISRDSTIQQYMDNFDEILPTITNECHFAALFRCFIEYKNFPLINIQFYNIFCQHLLSVPYQKYNFQSLFYSLANPQNLIPIAFSNLVIFLYDHWETYCFQIKETISRGIALSLGILYFDEKRQFRSLFPIYEVFMDEWDDSDDEIIEITNQIRYTYYEEVENEQNSLLQK